jgi:hypothetical protein
VSVINYTVSLSLIYGNFFGNIAAKIYLYAVVLLEAFDIVQKVCWITAFIEDIP